MLEEKLGIDGPRYRVDIPLPVSQIGLINEGRDRISISDLNETKMEKLVVVYQQKRRKDIIVIRVFVKVKVHKGLKIQTENTVVFIILERNLNLLAFYIGHNQIESNKILFITDVRDVQKAGMKLQDDYHCSVDQSIGYVEKKVDNIRNRITVDRNFGGGKTDGDEKTIKEDL